MDIGGIDHFFKVYRGTSDEIIQAMKNVISSYYPNAVFEMCRDNSFFAYRDEAAKKIWDDGEVEDSMIQIILDEYAISLTMVTGKEEPNLVTMVSDALKTL